MKTARVRSILSLSLIATVAGCAQNRTPSNGGQHSAYSAGASEQRLTPTSVRPGEPHIYSNSTSRATSPASADENQ